MKTAAPESDDSGDHGAASSRRSWGCLACRRDYCPEASIVAACESLDAAEQIQALLSMKMLRVYANADQRGVELAGALKNVIAIAAGIRQRAEVRP